MTQLSTIYSFRHHLWTIHLTQATTATDLAATNS